MEGNEKMHYLEPDLKLGMIINKEVRVGATSVAPV